MFKKGLISLGILGAIGGSGAGMYYVVNKGNFETLNTTDRSSIPVDESDANVEHQEDTSLAVVEDKNIDKGSDIDRHERADDNLAEVDDPSKQQGILDSGLEGEIKDVIQVSSVDAEEGKTAVVSLVVTEISREPQIPSDNPVNNEPSSTNLIPLVKVDVSQNPSVSSNSDVNLEGDGEREPSAEERQEIIPEDTEIADQPEEDSDSRSLENSQEKESV